MCRQHSSESTILAPDEVYCPKQQPSAPNATDRHSTDEQDWSDEGAAFASQTSTYTYPRFIWFPFLFAVATLSIQALNKGSLVASLFWIHYEFYIIFDHVPFLFTNSVYKSPAWNFTHLSTVFFWGMEAIACIIATQSNVQAPLILIYNAFPHLFFIVANNFNGAAASKSFVEEQKKTWWVYTQVIIDHITHGTCMWYHLKYLVSQYVIIDLHLGMMLEYVWMWLIVAACLLTYYVHKDEMSMKYFLSPYRSMTPKKPPSKSESPAYIL